MEVEKLIRDLKKRNNKDNKFNRIIGIELKKLRLKLNLTLQEVCSGICCTSYLSKMENNVVGVRPSYVSELFEKMNGKNSAPIIDPLQYENIINATIKAFYYQNTDVLRAIDNYTKNREMAYYLDIINMIMGIVNDDLDRSERAIQTILGYKETLEDEDLIVVALFIAIYYFKSRHYLECKKVLDSLASFELKGEKEILYLYYRFYTCFRLKKYLEIEGLFETLSRALYMTSNDSLLKKVKKDYLLILAIMGLHDKAKEIYVNFKEIHSNEMMAFLAYCQKMPDDVKRILAPVKNRNINYYCLMIKHYDDLKETEEAISLLKEIDFDHLDGDKELVDFLLYMRIKYLNIDDFSVVKEHLRNVILPIKYEECDIQALEFYVRELCFILTKEAHYKEALAVISKFNRLMEGI